MADGGAAAGAAATPPASPAAGPGTPAAPTTDGGQVALAAPAEEADARPQVRFLEQLTFLGNSNTDIGDKNAEMGRRIRLMRQIVQTSDRHPPADASTSVEATASALEADIAGLLALSDDPEGDETEQLRVALHAKIARIKRSAKVLQGQNTKLKNENALLHGGVKKFRAVVGKVLSIVDHMGAIGNERRALRDMTTASGLMNALVDLPAVDWAAAGAAGGAALDAAGDDAEAAALTGAPAADEDEDDADMDDNDDEEGADMDDNDEEEEQSQSQSAGSGSAGPSDNASVVSSATVMSRGPQDFVGSIANVHWAGSARDELNPGLLKMFRDKTPTEACSLITSHLHTLGMNCLGDNVDDCTRFLTRFGYRTRAGERQYNWMKVMCTFVRGALGIHSVSSEEYELVLPHLRRVREAFRRMVKRQLNDDESELHDAAVALGPA